MTFGIQEQASRQRRRLVMAIAGIAVAALALVGGGLWAGLHLAGSQTGGNGRTGAQTGDRTGHAAGPATAGDDGNKPAGKPSDGDDKAWVGSVQWSAWQGLALPVSSQHGPLQTAGGRASGFTRDIPGAVLAAIHISFRSQSYAGPSVYRPTIREQMTGPDRDDYLAQMESEYESARLKAGRPAGSPLPQPPVDILGFSTETAAGSPIQQVPVHLLLAQQTDDGQQCTDVRVGVVWIQDDWRVVAPAGGDGSSAMTSASCDATGYVTIPRQG